MLQYYPKRYGVEAMVNQFKEILFVKAGYLKEYEYELLEKAINFSELAHEGQKRATGEPYVLHPFTVCEILMDYKADITTLISALLHDVAEDTHYSIQDIEERFGYNVSLIVDGLTKIEKGNLEKEEYSAINTEKLLSASADDIRVAIVKITDRLHNIRTLSVKNVEKKVPYANETLVFFSPLAERLGLYRVQQELEELAFNYLNPPKYDGVRKLLTDYTSVFIDIFNVISEEIKSNNNNAFSIQLDWYCKPIYKSYSMLQEGYSLSDLFTIEIITSTPINCYTALGLLHGLYKPVENKFEDNIAIKKSLFSKNLTTMLTINGNDVKFQIKTQNDKNVNNYGVFKLLTDSSIEEIKKLSTYLLRDSLSQ